MWLWRRRSPIEKLGLPKRCFISHSYQDATAREQLLSLLPSSVVPIIFPPITVQPEEMVSNHLIESILDCDAVICLRGGASDESFWVAFERDYAIRAGKRVFSFDPTHGVLAPDTSKALDLAIFPIWGPADQRRVLKAVEFMRDERYFAPWDLGVLTQVTNENVEPSVYIVQEFTNLIERGGYGVIFYSDKSDHSLWFKAEFSIIDQLFLSGGDRRVVLVLLDPRYYGYPYDPDRVEEYKGVNVQLYGDDKRSELQRLDDLIVSLYWLIYRNTRHNKLN